MRINSVAHWRRSSGAEDTPWVVLHMAEFSSRPRESAHGTLWESHRALGSNQCIRAAGLKLRLGGIFALERIARDSEKDHWPIMEVLAAYVRENADVKNLGHTPAILGEDIAAILTVFRRRVHTREHKEHHLWLNNVDLRNANLMDTRLVRANLIGSNLDNALLGDVDLEQEAQLINATLKNTFLLGANLQETDLQFANVTGTSFQNVNLRGANLEGIVGLTADQLNDAVWDTSTRFPEYLVGDIPKSQGLGVGESYLERIPSQPRLTRPCSRRRFKRGGRGEGCGRRG